MITLYNYIICFALLIGSIPFFYLIGDVFFHDKNNFSFKFLAGYFLYSVPVGIFGIIVQFFCLPWMLFFVLTLITIFCFIILILISLKKGRIKISINKQTIKEFVNQHWLLVIITGLLVLISLLYVWLFWANNHQDDGYYLCKIATYPYVQDPFKISPSVGLTHGSKFLDSYIINTWESEASVFTYLFHISPFVYARFLLNAFNSFLLVNTIYAFGHKIFEKMKFEKYHNLYQYCILIVLYFSFNSFVLERLGLLVGSDLWQFNSAMYLASSIVRTSGILMLLVFFLYFEKIGWKELILYSGLSFVLMTKSTIALPFSVITFISVMLSRYLVNDHKNVKLLIAFFAGFFILSLAIPNKLDIQNVLIQFFFTNLHSIIIIGSLLLIFLSFFLKSKIINTINIAILIVGILMLVNPFNNLFELISIYPFVASRMLTGYMYTLMICACVYFYIFAFKIIKKKIYIHLLSLSLILALTFCSFATFQLGTGNIINSYRIIYHNPELTPKSTVMLSKRLENLYTEKGTINVLVPEQLPVNGLFHSLSVVIRAYAPDVNSISAMIRFGTRSKNDFTNFSREELDNFYEFSHNPNDMNFSKLKTTLSNYPINCIVVTNNDGKSFLESEGFTMYDSIEDTINCMNYYIYYKNK
ncbi:MAG: DUF6077 domain-containing protein [Erysipelotrichaceae bacterium]